MLLFFSRLEISGPDDREKATTWITRERARYICCKLLLWLLLPLLLPEHWKVKYIRCIRKVEIDALQQIKVEEFRKWGKKITVHWSKPQITCSWAWKLEPEVVGWEKHVNNLALNTAYRKLQSTASNNVVGCLWFCHVIRVCYALCVVDCGK